MRSWGGVALGVLLSTVARNAGAAPCTTRREAAAVLASARAGARCRYDELRTGRQGSCTVPPAPACAGTLPDDAIALAWGARDAGPTRVDARRLHEALACQRTISAGVVNFVGLHLRGLVDGVPHAAAAARARRALDGIPARCAVRVARDAAGVVLPRVGAQVAAAVGEPGSAVEPGRLRDALGTLLTTWVDRVGPQAAPLRPNIIVILTDDQRFDTIGLSHSRDGVTPVMPTVLHEIAEKGVRFDNAFATTALCAPSRASLLTGAYAHTTGVEENTGPHGGFAAFADVATLPVWLHDAGYRTGVFGKYLNGYGAAAPYVAPGWDEWHVFKNVAYYDYTLVVDGGTVSYGHADADYSTDVLRDQAVEFIRTAPRDQPFFLYCAPKAPHSPATPAPRHAGSFRGMPPWRPANYDEADVSDKPAWVRALPSWTAAREAKTDAFHEMQLESLQAVDEAVAAILRAVHDVGADDNTMVVYASDNGFSWGAHRWEPKQCPYEECMRVPLAIRYPPLAPLPRSEQAAGLNIDYAVTFAELAGVTPTGAVDGTSLVHVLDGTASGGRAEFLEEHWRGDMPTYVELRGTPWKYTEYVTGERELYDEAADPSELGNVADDPANAAVVTALSARLRAMRPDWPGVAGARMTGG